MNSFCYRLSLLLVLFTVTNAITFRAERFSSFCMSEDLKPNDNFTGNYIVSAYNENSIIFELMSPEGKIVRSLNQHHKEGGWHLKADQEGEYVACWANIEKERALISLDFTVQQSENSGETGLFTAEDIVGTTESLRELIRFTKKIRSNLRFEKVRDEVHTTNMDILNSRIHWSSFYKVSVLLGIACGQIYILKKLFSKKSQSVV